MVRPGWLGVFAMMAWPACGTTAPVTTPAAPECRVELDAGDAFARNDVDGVFVLLDDTTGCVSTTDPALAATPFSPKSTFKIPNSLIGLETGVIESEHARWLWDGTPRALDAWEQDLDLAGALAVSCVPCFQEVARQVGAARMQRLLDAFGYGNRDLSGPIDQFWLDGPLRISPLDQVAFLRRMLTHALPVSAEHVALVWRLLLLESGPGFHWYGKTGLGPQDGRALGWLVGGIERDGRRFLYATLLFGRTASTVEAELTRIAPLRRPITRDLLERAHVLPAAP